MKQFLLNYSKKGLWALVLAALSFPCAQARHLQPQEALMMLSSGAHKSASTNPLKLAYTHESEASGESTLYVFDRDNAPGFYILAADDAIGDIVLGYSHSSRFSPSDIPEGLSWLLDQYSDYIANAGWENENSLNQAPAYETRQPISPIMATQWGQDAPFNDLCPQLLGRRCVTGCVATAISQIMKVYEWPATGTGSSSYKYSLNGELVEISANFSGHVYDWSNMLDRYDSATSTEKYAVAQLMYDCAAASKALFTPSESSASVNDAGVALHSYFDYDKSISYDLRELYSASEWSKLIYNQLAEGHPIVYTGNDPSNAGHAFVIDGCDGAGYFHVNWGWKGLADAYYTLTALDPSLSGSIASAGAYSNSQAMLSNIKPNAGSPLTGKMAIDDVFTTDQTKYPAKNGSILLMGGFFSFALGELEYQLGMKCEGSVNNVVSLYTANIPPSSGFRNFTIPSSYFPKGEYDLSMVYKNGSDNQWHDMLYKVYITSGRLHVVNDGSTITITSVAFSDPDIGGIEAAQRDNASIAVENSTLLVNAPDDALVSVYGLDGKLFYQGTQHRISLTTGSVYIVRVAGKSFKIAIR